MNPGAYDTLQEIVNKSVLRKTVSELNGFFNYDGKSSLLYLLC